MLTLSLSRSLNVAHALAALLSLLSGAHWCLLMDSNSVIAARQLQRMSNSARSCYRKTQLHSTIRYAQTHETSQLAHRCYTTGCWKLEGLCAEQDHISCHPLDMVSESEIWWHYLQQVFQSHFVGDPLSWHGSHSFQIEHLIKEWPTGTQKIINFTEEDNKSTYLAHLSGLKDWKALNPVFVENYQKKLHDKARYVFCTTK